MAAGYRAFRIDGGVGLAGNVFDPHQRVREVAKICQEIREGVGEKGDWMRSSIIPTRFASAGSSKSTSLTWWRIPLVTSSFWRTSRNCAG